MILDFGFWISDLKMRGILTVAFLTAMFFLAGCQPNQEILKSAPSNATPTNPSATLAPRKTSFEQDVNDIRDAGLETIYVLRRKDGGVFDGEDKKYVRENTPLETNRFVFSEEGKTLIIGSGFVLPLQFTDALKKRFKFEDLSKPIEVEVNSSKNANLTNANQ